MPAAITCFTFAGGDLDGLSYAAAEQGFSVSPTDEGDGVVLATSDIIDELRWADFDDLMHGWAHQFGADYQGWAAAPPT
jgi:hypothetical protein